MKSKSLFSFMKNKFNVYAVSFLLQKKSWKWNCYLKAHTESYLWSLMTLTVPTLTTLLDSKMPKTKEKPILSYVCTSWYSGLGVWIYFQFLKRGFFSIWSYSITLLLVESPATPLAFIDPFFSCGICLESQQGREPYQYGSKFGKGLLLFVATFHIIKKREQLKLLLPENRS